MGAEPGALSGQLKHCLITGISSPIPGQEREREAQLQIHSSVTVQAVLSGSVNKSRNTSFRQMGSGAQGGPY